MFEGSELKKKRIDWKEPHTSFCFFLFFPFPLEPGNRASLGCMRTYYAAPVGQSVVCGLRSYLPFDVDRGCGAHRFIFSFFFFQFSFIPSTFSLVGVAPEPASGKSSLFEKKRARDSFDFRRRAPDCSKTYG